MKSMKEYAEQFEREHRGFGFVTNVTDYSFEWKEFQFKPNGRVDWKAPFKSHTYMLSWFWER